MAALEALDYRGGQRAQVRATIPILEGEPALVALRVEVARQADVIVEADALLAGEVPVETFPEADGTSIAWFHTDGRAVTVTYEATVALVAAERATTLTPSEVLRYTSPSRYCPSDAMAGFARAELGPAPGLDDPDAAATGAAIVRVLQWVNRHLSYEFGTSTGTTTAADTLLAASGVCRDFAHLSVALLRGLDVPARYVAAYAPGLEPPDFHALVEAHDGRRWRLFDATGLSDPTVAVRIATGVDSAETPFMTVLSGEAPVGDLRVSADLIV